jgi:hypothetical protein
MLEYFWDRDTWLFKQKAKIVVAIIVVFFISFLNSCEELRYWVSGKVTEGPAATRIDSENRHGEVVPQRVLGYSYDDGGTLRRKFINVPMDWPERATVKIQYIPGGDTSRLLGQTHRVWVVIFFGSLVAAAAGLYVLVKTA